MIFAAVYKAYQFQQLYDVGQGLLQLSLLPAQWWVMSLDPYLFLEAH